VLNGFAPVDGGGDRLRFRLALEWVWLILRLELRRGLGLDVDRDGEVLSSPDSKTSPSSVGGEGGRSFLAVGKWNGISVGEMYPPELDGPGPATAFPWAPASDNSSMGVMGGGGVNGGGGVISLLLNGDDGRFVVARVERFGRRDR